MALLAATAAKASLDAPYEKAMCTPAGKDNQGIP